MSRKGAESKAQSQSKSKQDKAGFSSLAELEAYLFPGKKRYRHRHKNAIGGKQRGREVATQRLSKLQEELTSQDK